MNERPGFIKRWVVAARCYALPASTISVVFGTVLAVTVGGAAFRPLLFAASLVLMAVLHTGANMINDVYDFRHGIDDTVKPVSGAIVRGWLTASEVLRAAWLLLIAGSALGLVIVAEVGMAILWIGLIGVAIGVLYTSGPFALKYHALGDIAVFINFGILGSLGAWTVQTGSPSWTPVAWAVPLSMLVVGILHANNWKDMAGDSANRIRTVAGLIGDKWSERYYAALVLGPFVLVSLFAVLTHIWTLFITLLALPLAIKLIKIGHLRHEGTGAAEFITIDGRTPQLTLAFGVLCSAGLLLNLLIK